MPRYEVRAYDHNGEGAATLVEATRDEVVMDAVHRSLGAKTNITVDVWDEECRLVCRRWRSCGWRE